MNLFQFRPILLHAVLLVACFFGTRLAQAQNLVPNPSFELLADTCPCNIGFQGTAKPLYWEKWNQSPEYFHACVDPICSFDTLIDVPQNGFGFQYALDGEAYVGMAAYDGWWDFREYVGCQLTDPLVVGTTYYLSFYTNVAMGGNYWAPTWACNNMGMLFTMQPNIWTDVDQPPFALRNYAHLHSTAVISDTANWTLVTGSFVADSAYPYLVLGNFFSDELTDSVHMTPGPSLGAYYFVDGVCVTTSAEGCGFTNGVLDRFAHRPVVFPNPANSWLEVKCSGTGFALWEVLDVTGRLITTGRAEADVFRLAVDVWPEGEYVLRLLGQPQQNLRFVVLH